MIPRYECGFRSRLRILALKGFEAQTLPLGGRAILAQAALSDDARCKTT
jgi:hypothetical protein